MWRRPAAPQRRRPRRSTLRARGAVSPLTRGGLLFCVSAPTRFGVFKCRSAHSSTSANSPDARWPQEHQTLTQPVSGSRVTVIACSTVRLLPVGDDANNSHHSRYIVSPVTVNLQTRSLRSREIHDAVEALVGASVLWSRTAIFRVPSGPDQHGRSIESQPRPRDREGPGTHARCPRRRGRGARIALPDRQMRQAYHRGRP